MASRDLTSVYQELRNETRKDRYERDRSGHSAAVLPKGGRSDDEAKALIDVPPEYVDFVESIKDDLRAADQNLARLRDLHMTRLSAAFASDQEISSLESQIDIASKQQQLLFRRCEGNLKRIATVGSDKGLSADERMVRVNLMRGLAAQIQALSKRSREQQEEFMQTLQQQENVQTPASDLVDHKLSFDELLDKPMNDENAAMMQSMMEHANLRQKEILRLVQSINQLAQMFKELNVLVLEQGTILDRIDYNVEQTLLHVGEANKHLVEANKHMGVKAMICIAVLIIMIIVFIVVLVMKNKN